MSNQWQCEVRNHMDLARQTAIIYSRCPLQPLLNKGLDFMYITDYKSSILTVVYYILIKTLSKVRSGVLTSVNSLIMLHSIYCYIVRNH